MSDEKQPLLEGLFNRDDDAAWGSAKPQTDRRNPHPHQPPPSPVPPLGRSGSPQPDRPTPPGHPGPRPGGRALGAALEVGRTRLLLIGLAFALAFVAVGARLVALGLPVGTAQPRLARSGPPPVMDIGRAEIVDRNGVLLATSLKTASLYANPKKLMDRRDTALRLAQVFPEIDADALLAKLRNGKNFVWVKRNLTPREKAAVNALGIPGLDFLTAVSAP